MKNKEIIINRSTLWKRYGDSWKIVLYQGTVASDLKKASNNLINLTIPFVMKIAVATLGNFHANPFGPELQVIKMLERRRYRGARGIWKE